MFEQCSEKARRVIFFARYEASQFGSPVIGAQHLLLGLVRGEKLLCSRWLPQAQPATIRNKVGSWTLLVKVIPTHLDLPPSEASKHVLFHAKDEADRLKSKHIGTEHSLLGLILEKGPTSDLLQEPGGDPGKLRPRFGREVERAHPNLFDRSDPPQERVPPAEVQIHRLWCNGKDTRDAVKRCHKHNCHWQKAL